MADRLDQIGLSYFWQGIKNRFIKKDGIYKLKNIGSDTANVYSYKHATPGNVVTVEDAVAAAAKRISIKMEPIQDLHGYDKPWVGGAGKNLASPADTAEATNAGVTFSCTNHLFSINGTSTGLGDVVFNLSPTAKLKANTRYRTKMNVISGTMSSSNFAYYFRKVGETSYINAVSDYTPSEDIEIDRVIYRLNSGVTATNVKARFQIEAGSTYTDWEPYENECLINGRTKIDVKRVGKNLFGGDLLRDAIVAKGADNVEVNETNSSERYLVFGANKAKHTIFTDPIFKENTAYTIIFTYANNSGSNLRSNLKIHYTDGTVGVLPNPTEKDVKYTCVIVTNSAKTFNGLSCVWSNGATILYYDECGIFEGDLTVQEFEEPQDLTYEVSFPTEAGTVYGSEIALNDDGSGTLTVETVFHEFDGTEGESSIWMAGQTGNIRFYESAFGVPTGAINATRTADIRNQNNIRCSLYELQKAGAWADLRAYKFGVINSYPWVSTGVPFESKADALTWLASMKTAGTPLQLCLELATPVTYQLTADEVQLLLGLNNVWSPDGSITEFIYPFEAYAIENVYDKQAVDNKLSDKTDKVSDAINGNFAALDEDGNLIDSGHKHSDYLTQHQDISGKANIDQGTENAGKFMKVGDDGDMTPYDVLPNTKTAQGNIVSFTDGADSEPMEITIGLEPVQDLHGYEYPWVGGAGKNLYSGTNVSGERVEQVELSLQPGTYTISAVATSTDTDDTTCAIVILSGNTTLATGYIDRNTRSSTTLTIQSASNRINFYAANTYAKGDSDTFTFTDIQIESGSTATQYAPYENKCPIIGHAGANVARTGFNQCDCNFVSGSINTGTGNNQSDSSKMRTTYQRIIPSKRYYCKSGANTYAFFYDKNKTYIGYHGSTLKDKSFIPQNISNDKSGGASFAKAEYVRFRYDSSSYTPGKFCLSFYDNGHIGEYEDYAGQTNAITFPSEADTVYGGTLTVNKDGTGSLVADHSIYAPTDASDFTNGVNNNVYIAGNVFEAKGYKYPIDINDDRSSHFVAVQATTDITYPCFAIASNRIFAVKASGIADNVTVWGAYLAEQIAAGTPVQFYLRLATPVTYQLSAEQVGQILSLNGLNNIWSDTNGAIEVVYTPQYVLNDYATKGYVAAQTSGKADKVAGAMSGNFAALDSNGNPIDSGKKAVDFAPTANPVFTGAFSQNRKANTTVGNNSFSSGESCEASAEDSHAEGRYTTANGYYSHAEGNYTFASGMASHAEGTVTIANHASQHAFGEYNVEDDSSADSWQRGNYVEIVGNGTSSNAQSNARTLDWDGNERLKGDLYVGCNEDSTGGTKVIAGAATANKLGGVKVGSGLAIDANGVLSVDIPVANGVSF